MMSTIRRDPHTGDLDKQQLILSLTRPREIAQKYGKAHYNLRGYNEQLRSVDTQKRAYVNDISIAQSHVRQRLAKLHKTILEYEREQHMREMSRTSVDMSTLNPMLSTLKFDDLVESIHINNKVETATDDVITKGNLITQMPNARSDGAIAEDTNNETDKNVIPVRVNIASSKGRRDSIKKLPPLSKIISLRKNSKLNDIPEDHTMPHEDEPPTFDPNIRQFSMAVSQGGYSRRGSILNPYTLLNKAAQSFARGDRKRKLTQLQTDKLKERKKIVDFFESNKNTTKPKPSRNVKAYTTFVPSQVRKNIPKKRNKALLWMGIDSNEKLKKVQTHCLLKTEKSFYGHLDSEVKQYYDTIQDIKPLPLVSWKGGKRRESIVKAPLEKKSTKEESKQKKSTFKV